MDNKNEPKKEYTVKPYTQEEVDRILGEIDGKLAEFIQSDKYKDVLLMMGNIGRYSLTNQIYILLQNPDASHVKGMKQWNYVGRSIKPGEKSIQIFAPIKDTVVTEVVNEDGSPRLDENGNPVTKRREVVRGFKPSFVFDVSQTKGKEFEAFRMDENTPVADKELIMQGLTAVVAKRGFTVEYASVETLGKGCYGLCNTKEKKILILEGMSDLQTVSTMVHECGHALAHTPHRQGFEGLSSKEKREIKEVEAESIACVVCSYLGLDTENFNFSYISGWAEGDISKFRKNMDVISQHAGDLIGGIEEAFQQDRFAKREEAKKAEEAAKATPKPKSVKKKTNRAVKQSEAVAV